MIYIHSDPKTQFHLFADDTAFFYSNEKIEQLETNINKSQENTSNWLKANKLTRNVDKSKLLFFDIGSNPKKKSIINVYINGQKLENNSQATCLAVILDRKLSWQQHIDSINSKINKGKGILRKLRTFVQENVLINIFSAFIKPYFDYGTLAEISFLQKLTIK